MNSNKDPASTGEKARDTTKPAAPIVPPGDMMRSTLLHIDASARVDRSISRDLSAKFVETWVKARPGDEVIRRDIGQNPPGFVTEEWIAASFTPKEKRTRTHRVELAESDELIAELAVANIVVPRFSILTIWDRPSTLIVTCVWLNTWHSASPPSSPFTLSIEIICKPESRLAPIRFSSSSSDEPFAITGHA